MPYELGWYIENEIVFMRLIGNVSAEEYQEAIGQINIWAKERNTTFHTITDNRRIERYPSMSVMTKVEIPKDAGWLIVIGVDNGMVRFASSIGSQILGLKFRMFKDETEALEFMQRVLPQFSAHYQDTIIDHIQWERRLEEMP